MPFPERVRTPAPVRGAAGRFPATGMPSPSRRLGGVRRNIRTGPGRPSCGGAPGASRTPDGSDRDARATGARGAAGPGAGGVHVGDVGRLRVGRRDDALVVVT